MNNRRIADPIPTIVSAFRKGASAVVKAIGFGIPVIPMAPPVTDCRLLAKIWRIEAKASVAIAR